MDAKTLAALKGSIEHWERVVEGEDIFIGSSGCALCGLFRDAGCAKCPVAEKTGERLCYGSPYDKIDAHRDKHEEEVHVDTCPTCKRLATAELNFLKSLLPKGK
jgi:hypothetical protein